MQTSDEAAALLKRVAALRVRAAVLRNASALDAAEAELGGAALRTLCASAAARGGPGELAKGDVEMSS